VRAEGFCKCGTDRRHGDALAAEEMARHVGDFSVEKFVHLANVVDPLDLQCRLEQSGETGKAERDVGLQGDGVAVCLQSMRSTQLASALKSIPDSRARRGSSRVSRSC